MKMMILSQTTDFLQKLVADAVGVIVGGFANVCKEIFKFILILLFAYFLAIQTFYYILELTEPSSKIEPYLIIEPASLTELTNPQVNAKVGIPVCLRTGPAEEKLSQIHSFMDYLEIEAEFEENTKKVMVKSEAELENFIKKEIHTPPIKHESINTPIKPYELISLSKQDVYNASRSTQTVKSSLAKKSKLRNEYDHESENDLDQDIKKLVEKLELNYAGKINKKSLSQDYLTPASYISSTDIITTNKDKETSIESISPTALTVEDGWQPFDDEYDHASFHRA